jgi:hypothetical protein
MKGALATAQIGQLAMDELAAVRRAVQSRNARTSTSGRVVQKGGVVTVEQARRKIKKRVEDDEAKLVRLLKARDDREAKKAPRFGSASSQSNCARRNFGTHPT